MAETLDTRDWQAGVDPDLVRHLQRPLRRSAAVGCAWAREALARGRLGTLPMFVSWQARWGMNEAALAGLRPVVHALGPGAAGPGEAPRIAAATGRVVAEVGPTVMAVARIAATQIDAPASGTRSAEARRAADSPASAGHEAAASGTSSPGGSPPGSAGPSLDLRVDPALLVAAAETPAPAAPPIVMRPPPSEPGLPPRPRTRPRLVTTMDLAREQAGAAIVASSTSSEGVREPAVDRGAAPRSASEVVVAAKVEATPAPATATPATAAPAIVVPAIATPATATPVLVAPAIVAPGREATASATSMPAAVSESHVVTVSEASATIVHASLPIAASPRLATPSTASEEPAAASSHGAPRVRARVLAGPVAALRVDGPQLLAARPRVHVATPGEPASPGLTELAPPRSGATRMDLGLPAAVASQVAPQPAPAPSPPTPSPPRPVVPARVETSQLDIPAIAQAVHRHLERELRWERERRGGRS